MDVYETFQHVIHAYAKADPAQAKTLMVEYHERTGQKLVDDLKDDADKKACNIIRLWIIQPVHRDESVDISAEIPWQEIEHVYPNLT